MKAKAPTVVICDDDDGVLDVCRIIVEQSGFKVRVAKDGKNLFKLLEHTIPALILLDLWMPNMGGEDVIKIIKKNRTLKNIPIVIISANQNAAKIARRAGVKGILTKPFDIADLEKILVKHVKRTS